MSCGVMPFALMNEAAAPASIVGSGWFLPGTWRVNAVGDACEGELVALGSASGMYQDIASRLGAARPVPERILESTFVSTSATAKVRDASTVGVVDGLLETTSTVMTGAEDENANLESSMVRKDCASALACNCTTPLISVSMDESEESSGGV